MLSLPELRKYYIHLYEELRNYIWDFNTVQHLANLEISLFRRFPLLPEVRANFNRLYQCISQVCDEDEYLDEAAKNLRDILNSTDELYSMIIQPKEV